MNQTVRTFTQSASVVDAQSKAVAFDTPQGPYVERLFKVFGGLDGVIQSYGESLGKPRGEWEDARRPTVREVPEINLRLKDPKDLPRVLTYLRDHTACRYNRIIERLAVDFPDREERFDVVYCLLSRHYNARIKVTVAVDEFTAIPSATSIFSGAGWLEREVYDRHGIFFEGNSDLRRLLTDYGFQGHPLRKDFPLTGYTEVRYDELQKRVLYEPVETAQEFRGFQFNNPWVELSQGVKGGKLSS